MSIETVQARLDDVAHADAVLTVLDSYARDPIGLGRPLSADVRTRLVPELEKRANALILLAFDGATPVGLANCFFGFSSFAARPLLNVHDLAVVPERRGQGIGRALLREAERHAREAGCCRMTLEVQEQNARARGLYRSFGFDESAERRTYFLEKALGDEAPSGHATRGPS